MMKQELNEMDVEQVNGGVVTFNQQAMMIGFTKMGKAFKVVNVSAQDADMLVRICNQQYKSRGEDALEKATYAAFKQRGWIA